MATEADEIKKKRSDAPRKGYQRYTVYLEIDVVRAMKQCAVADKVKMVDLFNEVIKDYLKQRSQSLPKISQQVSSEEATLERGQLQGQMIVESSNKEIVSVQQNESRLGGVAALLKRVWKK